MYIKHKTTEPRETDVNKKAMDNIVKFQEYFPKGSILYWSDGACKKWFLDSEHILLNHEEN